jgi:hypothetical protein
LNPNRHARRNAKGCGYLMNPLSREKFRGFIPSLLRLHVLLHMLLSTPSGAFPILRFKPTRINHERDQYCPMKVKRAE